MKKNILVSLILITSSAIAGDKEAVETLTSAAGGIAFAMQMLVVGGIFYTFKYLFEKIFKSKNNEE